MCSNNAFISQHLPAFLCHHPDTCLEKPGEPKDFSPGEADKALLTGSSRGCALTNGSTPRELLGRGGRTNLHRGEGSGSRDRALQLSPAPLPGCQSCAEGRTTAAKAEKFKVAWEAQINPSANPASASQAVWYFCLL